MKKYIIAILGISLLVVIIAGSAGLSPAKSVLGVSTKKVSQAFQKNKSLLGSKFKLSNYPYHKGITATVFWVGEAADASNGYIANNMSAWDSSWQDHYGGFDDPNNRNGNHPAGFRPNENPFYVALPYNDFDENGNRRVAASKVVYWAKTRKWAQNESMVKNQWVRIVKNGREVFAQWEDSGPFVYDDSNYVFGRSLPKNRENNRAGIDVSPAVRDYLGLGDMSKVDWQFINDSNVPSGPWKEIVTTSQLNY